MARHEEAFTPFCSNVRATACRTVRVKISYTPARLRPHDATLRDALINAAAA